MRQATTPRAVSRSGFTLVELLVVILIIAILVALAAAALFGVLRKAPEVQARTEIGQFEIALMAARNSLRGVQYLPSRLKLHEDNSYTTTDPDDVATVAFLKKVWPNINLTPSPGPFPVVPAPLGGPGIDWNGNGQIDAGSVLLEGEQCLVFWLGGIPNPAGPGVRGFNSDPTIPGANGNGTFNQPFFTDFKSTRLVPGNGGFFAYADPFNTGRVYAYFTSYPPFPATGAYNVTDCMSLGVAPYQSSATTFINPSGFQIISAGKDGVFGPGGVWNPSNGYGPWTTLNPGGDDLANFSQSVLGSPQS
jgi:general secretion pathway protein G